MINLFIIALPIVVTINLLLGMIVLATNVKRLANRVFCILSLVNALWLTCQYFGSITTSEVWLKFWIRQACAASVFIPLFFHLLRSAATQPNATVVQLMRHSKIWLTMVLATALLTQTRFFLVGAKLSTGGNALAEPTYGPGMFLFTGFWMLAVTNLIWRFFQSLTRSEGVYRLELQIMAYGTLFALVPGVVLILIMPLILGSSQSARFAPIAVAIWHSVIAYGIATRHIMGVGEFFRRTLIWALIACILAIVYLIVFNVVVALPFYGSQALLKSTAHVVAAIVIALSLAPTKKILKSRAEKLFESDHEELAQLVREGGELARSITTIDALFKDFSRLLQKALGITQMRVYLRKGTSFVPHDQHAVAETGGATIPDTNPLVHALQTERYPILRDVLRRTNGTPLELQAERTMAIFDAEAAVALHAKNEMIGFLLLGRRKNGRIFGKREENALIFLGQEMGFAIENATLYTRLQEARNYNEVLLDNLVTGVIAIDKTMRITVCNREAQRILNIAEHTDIIGCSATKILPEPFLTELKTSLASGQGVRDKDCLIKLTANDEKSIRFATDVFSKDAQAATGALLVLQDTSALQKLQEQVRRSDRLASIGTLAAGMAHEIKNPLVCLKTFAQLLPDQYENPEFRKTFIPLLRNEVERINTIVTQLLNFSRPVKPELVPISLHAALDGALQLALQQVNQKQLVLAHRYHAEHDQMLGDQRLLGQVFLNLFLNGIDAMEQGGKLTVSTHLVNQPAQPWKHGAPRSGNWLEVRVHDTGPGIDTADRQRIFDPFFTTKTNGTGLGLSVAHSIIQEHNGVIDVESSPGTGTCFHVFLPALEVLNENNVENLKGTT